MPARFIFAACQCGAERALKNDVARRQPALRPAFSRPGFVTFRVPDDTPAEGIVLDSAFARTWGYSLGKATGADAAAVAREAWRLVRAELTDDALRRGGSLHVWQRDRNLPGDDAFDPASLTAAADAGAALLAERPDTLRPPLVVNENARRGDLVLDCVLVEPLEWWVGWHRADAVEMSWPGGVPPLPVPERLISRAYLKVQEALLWSGLPIAAADRCIEIGSAPGGSCLALLERGCTVTGIDPAEMEPLVLAHPGFTHLRAKAKEVKRSVFRECRWLMMDANVAPNYTLDVLGEIVAHRGVRPDGLLLTLKLTDPSLVTQLAAFAGRIRQWGYRRIRLRQLAFNRQEVCAVATERSGSRDAATL